MSKQDVISHYLDGIDRGEPTNWNEIKVELQWPDGSFQSGISGNTLDFTGDSLRYILQHIDDWGIFEGIPYTIGISNKFINRQIFNGYLDLQDQFDLEDPSSKDGSHLIGTTKLKKRDAANTVEEKLAGLTAGYLESIGVYSNGDYKNCEYVFQRPDGLTAAEVLILTIQIISTIIKIQEFVTRLSTTIANGVAHTTGGVPTGPAAGAIFTIVMIVIDAALTTVMAVQTLQMTLDTIEILISPVRKHKVISVHTYLRKAVEFLGYNLIMPISGVKNEYILPTPPGEDEDVVVGIPRSSDPAYFLGECIEWIKREYNAETRVDGDDFHVRTKSDPYWRSTSTFILPDVRLENQSFNANKVVANVFTGFTVDVSEAWTVRDFDGTNHVASISQKQVKNQDLSSIKGFTNNTSLFSLGSRKDKLSKIEEVALDLAQATDTLIEAFGGTGSAADKIKARVGMLKLGDRNYNNAKLIRLQGGKIPANHRILLSAKARYDNFHYWDSFAVNPTIAQKSIHKGIEIKFRLADFGQVVDNPFFKMNDGRTGRFTRLEWSMDEDVANVDIEIEGQYTSNLKETYVTA